MSFQIGDDIIDSRDVIQRIEELESELESVYEDTETAATFEEWLEGDDSSDEHEVEIEEYLSLKELAEEASQYAADWEYGEALIHERYFTEYCKEMVLDIYNIGNDLDNLPSWIVVDIDWEATADNIKVDYTAVEVQGEVYYVR